MTRSARLDVLLSIVDTGVLPLFTSDDFNAEGARLCNGRRIPYLPGCATTTEIVTAEESLIALVAAARAGGPSHVPAKESRS